MYIHQHYNQTCSRLTSEGDTRKARRNTKKHDVAFEDAAVILGDEEAPLIADMEHSMSEERYVLLGMGTKLRILVVCHTHQEESDTIWIIPARRATPSERNQYLRGFTQ